MGHAILGLVTKRIAVLLAVMGIAMFSASSLAPGEPAAQTTSANGKIVYVGFDEETQQSDLYTMNADGTGVSRLTDDQHEEGTPEWSPDGARISFHSSEYDNGSCCSRNVYVMNADGTGRQRLTTTPNTSQGEDTQATWSPDGSWLAFVSTRDESREFAGDRELYRMNVDGTEQTQLTNTDYRTSDEQPSVSPDGQKIAFASNRADTTYGTLDIFVMNADGTDVQRLTFDGAYDYPLERRNTNPAWSPDGSRIVFESTRDGNSEVYVMNADGSGLVNVSQDPGYDAEPAWSPDGAQITFTSLRSGQYDIWADDAPPEPTTAATFSALDVGPDAVLAASEPRNLTADSSMDASTPDWGTAAPSGGTVCTIKGTQGTDILTGTPGADVICGRGGSDVIDGKKGGDVLRGGPGSDSVQGNSGADKLHGGDSPDALDASDGVRGNDAVYGGAGRDACSRDRRDYITGCP